MFSYNPSREEVEAEGQHGHISRSCLKQRNKQTELEWGKVDVDNFMTLRKSYDFDKWMNTESNNKCHSIVAMYIVSCTLKEVT